MARDLLWLELLLKSVVGGLMLCFPRTVARIFGLPQVSETFWPRLLGATLLGLAVATLLERQLDVGRGLGLSGQVAINLTVVLALVSLLIVGKAGATRRGRIFVALLAVALSFLALVELAWL